MKKKGAFTIQSWLLAFLVFSVVILTGVLMIGDMNSQYSKNLSTEDFGNSFDTIDEMYDISQGQKNASLGGEISDADTSLTMITGAYSAIRFVTGSFGLFYDIINDIADVIGIPGFMITAALIAVTILVIFAVIQLVFRT